ncbi:MAG TPA: JAB domain-containing protein [Sphingobacterium sp.]|nr:JAB domain-containing protein [Sphingobacterium sp.]
MNQQIKQITLELGDGNEAVSYKTQLDYKLKPYDEVSKTGTTIQPMIDDFKQFDFTGKRKIESHADVAALMAVLESKSVEHIFAVHVNREKDPLIQYLGTGGRTGVYFDRQDVYAMANIHSTESLYLVHNHPSGNLTPSKADIHITKEIEGAVSALRIDVKSLIINTYKEGYTLINSKQSDELSMHLRPEKRDEVKHSAVSYHDMAFLGEPIATVTNSRYAAAYIQQLRFSAKPKQGILVTNIRMEAIGNFFVDDLTPSNIAKIAAAVPTATGVIGYGNVEFKGDINLLNKRLDKIGIHIHDYIQTNSNGIGIKDAYRSLNDEGVLRDLQQKYKTNQVGNEQHLEERAATYFKR